MKKVLQKIFGWEGQAASDQEVLRRQLRAAYRDFYAAEQGKLILDDLCSEFYFLSPTFSGDKDEALFREGCRNVILYIIGMIRSPEDDTIKEVTHL